MNDVAPKAFSLELALVIGLPALAILAGAWAASLAYSRGFTPADPPAATQAR